MKRLIIYIMLPALLAGFAYLFTQKKLQFQHKKHSSFECAMCHATIPESKKASDNNLPNKSKTCAMCHQDKSFLNQVSFSKPSIQNKIEFNHSKHTGDFGLACAKCHSNINENNYNGNAYPSMETCKSCHSPGTEMFKCSRCHTEKVQFPHKTHNDKGLPCEFCHAKIKESKTTSFAPDIPNKKLCLNCHTNEYPSIVKMNMYTQNYEFNHARHLTSFGFTCDQCHAVVKASNSFKPEQITPKMDFCTACHNGEVAPQACNVCHALAVPRPLSHDFNWQKLHKVEASKNKAKCMSCHISEDFCTSCHRGSVKPMTSHNPNYELTHKFESTITLKSCKSCHSNSECMSCHIQKGVTQRNNPVLTSPHPAGWLNKQSPEFHARRARMRLTQCRACHIKTDCNFCHLEK